jgi:uncharacterized phiE125 gp8 family phage protein
MTLKLQTAATVLPVSLVEAKLHLRVDGVDEDALITSLIGSATLEAEHLMGRAVMPQKWQLTLDAFESEMALQRPPVTGVDSVTYVNTAGTPTVLSAGVYQVIAGSDYTASIVLAYGQSWPAVRCQREAVKVVFSTGYADAASVPEPIKTWIKLRVGALYENRESWTYDKPLERNAHTDYLLDRYRTWLL